MKKILTLIVLGCTLGIASADIAFILNPEITGSAIGEVALGASSTITTNASGNDLVYSFTHENVDLDGGGLANDTLTFDVRWGLFRNSTLTAGEITLGNDQVGIVEVGHGWQAIDTHWNTDTLKFTVENISLTADAGYTATFDGFNRMWTTAGTCYVGEGAGTTAYAPSGNGNLFFRRKKRCRSPHGGAMSATARLGVTSQLFRNRLRLVWSPRSELESCSFDAVI